VRVRKVLTPVLPSTPNPLDALSGVIGHSLAMVQLFDVIRRVSGSRAILLLRGESGTGKELLARTIHALSPRRSRAFVAVHCAALPETLLESELFGHERGAFTGAISRRRGAFELAHGGTLLLDEIGEIPPSMQVKLLRVLQEREFQRVGGERPIAVDVRVIAATNQLLERRVDEGRFRQDLYYRLKVVPVTVPPLRERRDDIPLLAEHFRLEYVDRLKRKVAAIGPDAMATLLDYHWPGNVRELRHAIERAVLLAGEQTVLTRALLPSEMQTAGQSYAGARAEEVKKSHHDQFPERSASGQAMPPHPEPQMVVPSAPETPASAAKSASIYAGMGDWTHCAELLKRHGSLDELMAMIEWQIVTTAMAAHGGNKSRAAKALGRSYRWLRKLESRLEPPSTH